MSQNGPRKSMQQKIVIDGGNLQHGREKRRTPEQGGETFPPNGSLVGRGASTGPLGTVLKAIHEYLLLDDADAVPVMLAAVAAHKLDSDPAWLLLVGPPASGKTELIGLLNGLPGVEFLSDVTPQTFASGYVASEGSLLDRLNDNVIAIKELTTLLSKRAEARTEIMGQLRELHDGQFDKSWGTGKTYNWTGRISLVAGVTEAIDDHHGVMGALGPRFLLLRVQLPDRRAVARAAIRNRNIHDAKKAARRTVRDFFKGLTYEMPELPEHLEERLIEIADFVTRARSVVKTNEKGDPEYAPPHEGTGRLVRQLHGLTAGLAVVNSRNVIIDEDVRRAERVAFDCIPPQRRIIIDALRGLRSPLDFLGLTILIEGRVADRTLRRELQSLLLLGVVACDDDGNWLLREPLANTERGAA